MPADNIAMLYVPCGTQEEAAKLATSLLEQKLIACANVLPSQSFYVYEGKMVNEAEHILLCKTTKERAPLAQERIAQLHSYDIPCIITIETVSVNPAYAAWITGQVLGDSGVFAHDTAPDRSEVMN